jgi:hypothetical protein
MREPGRSTTTGVPMPVEREPDAWDQKFLISVVAEAVGHQLPPSVAEDPSSREREARSRRLRLVVAVWRLLMDGLVLARVLAAVFVVAISIFVLRVAAGAAIDLSWLVLPGAGTAGVLATVLALLFKTRRGARWRHRLADRLAGRSGRAANGSSASPKTARSLDQDP